VKKYLLTASSIRYLNIDILYSGFLASQDGERGWLSRLRTRYRKVVGEYKDIESNFYSNDSLHDDLDNIFLLCDLHVLNKAQNYTLFSKSVK
jgi:hypothetical protein